MSADRAADNRFPEYTGNRLQRRGLRDAPEQMAVRRRSPVNRRIGNGILPSHVTLRRGNRTPSATIVHL